ncbi:MAG: hypothetical protein JOZ14_07050 [Acidobacteria bacterium]|nr:hypothetical protein [Acidobacteriota bacterium]
MFSTGNVHGLQPVNRGGPIETTLSLLPAEYVQSALARERMFEYRSYSWAIRVRECSYQ